MVCYGPMVGKQMRPNGHMSLLGFGHGAHAQAPRLLLILSNHSLSQPLELGVFWKIPLILGLFLLHVEFSIQ